MQQFIMLVGLPGCGKTTYAKELLSANPDFTYLSSDSIRKELYGDESIQGEPSKVFSLMQQRALNNLRNGLSVIYDSTGIKRKDRLGILKQVKAVGANRNIRCYCHIVWAKFETCIDRNNRRSRVVPEEVIWRMAKQFQTPWYDEGWDNIKVIRKDSEYRYEELPLKYTQHDNSHHLPDSIADHINRVYDILQDYVEKRLQAQIYGKDEPEEIKHISKEGLWDLRDMSLLHDIGKVYTKDYHNSKGEVTQEAHYYQHQNVGAYMALGTNHPLIKDFLKLYFSYLTLLHMEPFFEKSESNYWKNLDQETKDLIYFFNECDKKGA